VLQTKATLCGLVIFALFCTLAFCATSILRRGCWLVLRLSHCIVLQVFRLHTREKRPAESPFFDLDCALELPSPTHRNRREHSCPGTAPTEPMQTEHEAFAA
jgi:hypothetical protein